MKPNPFSLPCLLAKLLIPMAVCVMTTVQAQIWSEEFNSGTTPDHSVWSYDFGAGGWGNNELQTYTSDPANVRVEGGNLVITAIRQGNSFTSARIHTENKLTFKYGTVEARIKVPDLANGLWPAFWTLGENFPTTGWPDCGEIDILEMGSRSAIDSGEVNRRVASAAHWESNNSTASYGQHITRPADIDGSFHLYRMEWTPTAITTFIDDIQIWSIDISDPTSFDGEEFHQPHFILLNMAVGGTYPTIFSSSSITAPTPAEYEIDYIRIFDNGFTVLGGSSVVPNLCSSLTEGNIELRFPTVNGIDYNLTYKNRLTDPAWILIETIPGDGTTQVRSYPADSEARFYQINQ